MVISVIYFTCDSPPHIFYFVLTVINNNILGGVIVLIGVLLQARMNLLGFY